MKGMTLENIALACKGEYIGDPELKNKEVEGIVIDSRKVEKDFLFIAVKGARVDGHDFAKAVYEKGAACVLVEKEIDNDGKPYILVKSTLVAIQILAAYYRRILGIRVVGITGSVGKTSTKEMIAAVLSTKYKVLKTEGNYNNGIGLPLTIFNLRQEHQIAVLEMGISEFGEMHVLAEIARPDICVITNIGQAHLETLKSRDGILKAKSEIFDFINHNGRIILNGDDDKLSTIEKIKDIKPIFFGRGENNNVYASNVESKGLEGMQCVIHVNGTRFPVIIPIPGEHMVNNALAATCVGKCFGLSNELIAQGIMKSRTISGRSNVIQKEKYTIIDDCYNANPVSMHKAIDLLALAKGRKIAILGDMMELGTDEAELHYEVGKYAVEKEIDYLICIGKRAQYIQKGAMDASNGKIHIVSRPDKSGIEEMLNRMLEEGDTILIKASHSMEFESIVKFIEEK
ncbi:UDP-N-acetylmuramoyl-tripeptide--D-alanyl-D-alanine ligase [Acetitomaculum ruminis DSM 5522]|uniref:UDP-N-acetylmuramoyl-tripeptide--D-alanyl-D-alanine ligase n=1 Tax=Acetitomaculum ruminis DSM 5522 TaxID=1120918 RepID=A0A1I0YB95_9FIRM|nr:UDP-N-acetylmuramoyl-tripeptide--D-alanyl-D-alanine ligase [Acetitomaculum ruminis]SFB10541.1 UDP-N-acetylmuramoyl-tripeptide--D-alanyl-D-alanine ligase [Acetitomaculum ruminis DSM 5522]